ncbi:MAG TPA: NFACT RNA binding domain-containing protein [Candidatus Saccharimonadales bacterium]|nr:NFACT RNA binding domain-containing protein [Candidatus Saccharimonadales bacterium]
MDLLTARRLAAEWAARTRGERYRGLARLDPRRVAVRLGSERWALLLDEAACGVYPAGGAAELQDLRVSLQYLDEALTGWQVEGAAAEPGRLRLLGSTARGPLEISLLGPPRPFLLAMSGDEVRAGYRRPADRPWQAHLPAFAPGATEAAPGAEALEAWIREHPGPMRSTALARLSLALTVSLAREARHRAGGDQPEAVARAAAEVLAEAGASGRVWVYAPAGRPALISAARLTHLGEPAASAATALEALAALDAEHLEPARRAAARRAAARPAQARQARAERTLEKLATEAAEAGGAGDLERAAHALLAHGATLPRGTPRAELPDLGDPSKLRTIELDPTRTGVENATALLRRAARLARRAAVVQTRVAAVRAELEAAGAEAERILASAGWPELERAGVLAEERAGGAREAARGGEPGRGGSRGAAQESGGEVSRLTSEEGWAVLVGRNDRQNEFLTHRLARPADLWFHAAHVPGSHVVLRRDSRPGDPSRRTLEEVAGYAAWMSKARTSSRVPVLMAEKRHVRRARGGPGKVVVERGKTLIVKPRKPGS